MSSVNDSKETIHATFQEKHKELEALLTKLQIAPASQRPPIIDELLSGISHLSDLLKDATSYLPAYDQRNYSLKVKTLADQLSSIRQTLAPRQKFAFKSRRVNGATIGGAVSLNQLTAPLHANNAVLKAAAEQENLVVSDQTDAHIRPDTVAGSAASLLLSELSGCIVALPATAHFSSAAVKHVDRCVLLLGTAVAGPVHLTAVTNSVLVFACHQMRMHDARNVDVYLHCGSRPIIEDCEDIRFHRFGDAQGNMWDQVDDFKWLRSDPSPHWRAEREGGEAESERWREIGEKEVGELEVAGVLGELLP